MLIKILSLSRYTSNFPLPFCYTANDSSYIGGATQPGVTLQGTLMSHSSTVDSISSQVDELNYRLHRNPFHSW
jgi:hypothetical protein